jgi:hypothetical protein
MINFYYARYLFMKYVPLAISAVSGAFFLYYLVIFDGVDQDGIQSFLCCALFISSVGWFTVFLAEERLRKLMTASHNLIESISKALKEAGDED